jgi:two-component system, NtrC family, nitrogen regulation sensor histidine kinase NtrY
MSGPRQTSRHRAPQRYFERWTYDVRIVVSAVAVAMPGAALLAVVIIWRELSWNVLSTLIAIGFVTTFALAIRLRNRVIYPLYTLSNLLEALREGDFSLRGSRARRGDPIGEVVWEINTLSQTLRDQRHKVEETSALLTKVIGATDIAIFTFDDERRLRVINPAGEHLLARPARELIGRTATELGVAGFLKLDDAQIHNFTFPGSSGRFEVRRGRFREGGRPHDLLVVADLSRALREEERAAWQRLLRVLGHELNNSLAPIRSMTGTLGKLLAQEPPAPDSREDLASGLAIIGDRAEALTRFMASYTALARLPPPNKRDVEIGELVQRVARLEQRVGVDVNASSPVHLFADPDQIEQALINLIKNAVDAALPKPDGVRARWRDEGDAVEIEIEDDGPGLGGTENLFVPFFTTKPGGSGIGLVLARQIAEAHDGTLTLENRANRPGCIAHLRLPLGERAASGTVH